MKNTSDYLMLGLLLICMRLDKKVCYKELDNTKIKKTRQIALVKILMSLITVYVNNPTRLRDINKLIAEYRLAVPMIALPRSSRPSLEKK